MNIIYTDGSCIKNPNGPGGYAYIVINPDGTEWHFSDGNMSTTNNRMELTAVIKSLEHINIKEKCKIYSDSQLTINCATGKWTRKANLDLWSEYDKVSKDKIIEFEWVKAHNGNKYNEMVDKMALAESKKLNF